ncbi:phosphonoacetate hydrolase [Propionivibrio soli]|uniref:phosphonoacetate hydrolase n=1 Tax=Propionivibrio soli TaxID=2976531 RepID=UPI0021E929EE|nr:phosphonoacetate hydrolase [Propionivibrio soli]
MPNDKEILLNGVTYRRPSRPVVAVCIDGGDPAYIERGLRDDALPNIARFIRKGFTSVAEGTVPSFTCPNNVSLVTGAPPSVHGISGNFYLDSAGKAVVMTSPELLRSRTLLAEFADAGARVIAITAKDKLREQLGSGVDVAGGNICFSSEKADRCTLTEHGIENVLERFGMPLPDMYSMELSLFVLHAGVRLLNSERPDLMYLSLTDFIQHKHAPGDPVATAFYRRIDELFGQLDELGATVALTADHGMSDKAGPDGKPNVVFLQDLLDQTFGTGTTQVICPITDAFVRHHGALGGFVRVWCLTREVTAQAIINRLQGVQGIAEALDRATVSRRYALPVDREGDVAVIAEQNFVIGSRAIDHDLTALSDARLRSHGGPSEAWVPFILNRPLNQRYAERATAGVKSYQLFDYAINGTDVDA